MGSAIHNKFFNSNEPTLYFISNLKYQYPILFINKLLLKWEAGPVGFESIKYIRTDTLFVFLTKFQFNPK